MLLSREEHLRKTSLPRLVFSPVIKRECTPDTSTVRERPNWIESLLHICLYPLLVSINVLASSSETGHKARRRFGLVLPVPLLANAGMSLRVASWLRDTGTVIAACVAGTEGIVICGSHGTNEEAIAQIIVVSVLVFTNTLMKVRTTFVFTALCWAVAAELFLLVPKHGSTLHADHLSCTMVFAVGILTIIANCNQQRESRLASLRFAEQRNLVTVLAEANEHLSTAARTDGLTGLANRAALDEYLATVWSDPRLAGKPCSAVMVDIDHFKNLNDRYGHLYGDRVLKRVAHLIAEALRGEADFVARFGGEEFVVILPCTPAHAASIVAERLRGLIELAGLPAIRADDPGIQGLRATISCGVAAAVPEFCRDPYLLIKTADQALYQAKRDGRNLVRTALSKNLRVVASTFESDVCT